MISRQFALCTYIGTVRTVEAPLICNELVQLRLMIFRCKKGIRSLFD